MDRKYSIVLLLGLVIILSIIGCGNSKSQLSPDFQPPIENLRWGMSLAEALEVLETTNEYEVTSDEATATLQCDNMELLGQSLNVTLLFQTRPELGLIHIQMSGAEFSKEKMSKVLNEQYYEYLVDEDEGVPHLWKYSAMEELPEEIQSRLQYLLVTGPTMGEVSTGFSPETVWNSRKKQALVEIVLNDIGVKYNGVNMATYMMCVDEETYQDFLKEYQ